MRKFMSVMLAACIMLCAFTSNAVIVSAASGGTVGDCHWQLNGTELTITGNGSMGYCVTWPWGKNITKVTIEQGVTTIGISAFSDCTSLKTVTLPEGLKMIENFAFLGCTSLLEMTIPESVFSIGIEAFADCRKLIDVIIPKNVTDMGQAVFDRCDKLYSITVDEANLKYSSLDGVLFNKNKTLLIKYPGMRPAKSYTIPNSVKEIAYHAFHEAWFLECISIPDTVTHIGASAFFYTPYYNNKSNYVDGILYLGKHIIDADENYSSFTLREDIKTIADGAFVCCDKVKEIVIPDGVVTIAGNAFSCCSSLEMVYIPKSVTTIGQSAFYDCNKLENIHYQGNNKDRNKIMVDRYNSELDRVSWNYEACFRSASHSWNSGTVIKQPNCTDKGDLLKKCTVCGREKTESIKAVGHKYSSWAQTKAPLCTEKGEEQRNCSVCSHSETRFVAALGHKFSSSIITKQPTCTQPGIESGACVRCGKETSSSIEALGHRLDNYIVKLEPTCTAEGKKEGTCTICGAKAQETIAAKGHIFGEGVVTKEATETEEGVKTSTCTACGETKEETIPFATSEPITPDEDKITDTATDESKDDSGGNDTYWVIIAIAVVVLIGCGITAVLLIKKKKANIVE
ncbi:MAG: leucine-rich repeat protein [Clostridia bacterium]|nr:leucine-rich repeat protein [Clostridia bacterium]